MVKPQFEVGKERLGKGGVVRDPACAPRRSPRSPAPPRARGWGAAGGRPEPAARSLGQRRVLPLAAARPGRSPTPTSRPPWAALRRPRTPRRDATPRHPRRSRRCRRVMRGWARDDPEHPRRSVFLRRQHPSRRRLRGRDPDVHGARRPRHRGRRCSRRTPWRSTCRTPPWCRRSPDGAEACAAAELVMVIGGDGTILRAAELARDSGTPLLGVNLGHVGFLAEAEPEDIDHTIDRDRRARLPLEERLTLDVTVLRGQGAGRRHLGAQRGQRREGGPRADARGRRRGRRPAAEPLGLRRCRVRDPDRLHGVQLLRRRAGRLARGGGAADGADQGPRPLRPADGGLALLACWRSRSSAAPERAGVLWATGAAPSSCHRAPGSRSAAGVRRSGWRGCTRPPSPTGSSPSSACPSPGGAEPPNAGGAGERRRDA